MAFLLLHNYTDFIFEGDKLEKYYCSLFFIRNHHCCILLPFLFFLLEKNNLRGR